MKEKFEVIEIDTETMKLKVNRSSGCQSCSASSGCGTGILAKYFDHYSVFNKPMQKGVIVGDLITLEISSSELFKRAFQLYMLPLLSLFAGGLLANGLYPVNEPIQIAFGFIGFLLALFAVKYFVK
ncbi:Sigma factor RpoE regulatory protein RseC [uncultured Candidatus Thioglobus sp.]|nr:Sigma factor RpoE regulatory protein RseC [uncultured Candidatus Thioglobus sp.]